MNPEFRRLSELKDLAAVLSNDYTPPTVSIIRQHTQYLFSFLVNELNACVMLIESDYFSQSYFDDYKFFHVNSFVDFNKTCERIHFFSKQPPRKFKTTHSLFDNMNTDESVTEFWKSYLGYIVVRPIPHGIIGATILRFPKEESEYYSKKITVAVSNNINIFGYQYNNLTSLIYQEQDKIVGACATASLWSALDKAHELFGTFRNSPSKLTEMAGESMKDFVPQRRYPNNNGLTLYQIAHLIEELDLDHEIVVLEKKDKSQFDKNISKIEPPIINKFLDFIYAYIKCGFPLLMGVEFGDKELHSLTVVGYKEPMDIVLLNKMASANYNGEEYPYYKSHFINEFYVHDDQIGPFKEILITDSAKVKIDWQDTEFVKFWSAIAIIHPTWIVSVSIIKKQVLGIHVILKHCKYEKGNLFYFDFYLSSSNEWKTQLNCSKIISGADIIYKSLPQYLWIVDIFRVDKNGSRTKSILTATIIFDITSLSGLENIIDVVIYDQQFLDFIKLNKDLLIEMIRENNSNIDSTTLFDQKLSLARRENYLLKKLFLRDFKNSAKK